MTKARKKYIIDNFKQESFTEEESIIIVKLEQYADILTNIKSRKLEKI